MAFYPGACNEQRHPADWTTGIPLLVLNWGGGRLDAAGALQDFSRRRYRRGSAIDLSSTLVPYHGFDAPNNPRRELPEYKTRAGVVPIIGTDPAAGADALLRVPTFLDRYLKD